MPSSNEVRTLTARVQTDLAALSDNIDRVDELLNGVAGTADVVNGHIPELQYWFSPTGQRGFDQTVATANYIATVLPGFGSITLGGYWLVPLLKSLADSSGALQLSKVAPFLAVVAIGYVFRVLTVLVFIAARGRLVSLDGAFFEEVLDPGQLLFQWLRIELRSLPLGRRHI